MKVIGSRSRSHDQKGQKSLFPQCKTFIGNNSGSSIEDRAVKFVYSMGLCRFAHWAELDYGLSAGQHAVLPEGEGKGVYRCGGSIDVTSIFVT